MFNFLVIMKTSEEILIEKYHSFKQAWSLNPVDSRYKTMVLDAMHEYAKSKNKELEDLFDLAHKANLRAIEIYQKGKHLPPNIIPDQTDMVLYLIGVIDKQNKVIDFLKENGEDFITEIEVERYGFKDVTAKSINDILKEKGLL